MTMERRQHEEIERARDVLAGARRVLIGAGSGLSTAAGLRYGGERFRRHMASFIERYGITDMYSAAHSTRSRTRPTSGRTGRIMRR